MDDNLNPVLLSKSELQWLRNDIKVSKSFEYKIKSSIKRKIQTLTELELPLLVQNNFLVNANDCYNDSNLGTDFESGPPLSYPSNDTALLGLTDLPFPLSSRIRPQSDLPGLSQQQQQQPLIANGLNSENNKLENNHLPSHRDQKQASTSRLDHHRYIVHRD